MKERLVRNLGETARKLMPVASYVNKKELLALAAILASLGGLEKIRRLQLAEFTRLIVRENLLTKLNNLYGNLDEEENQGVKQLIIKDEEHGLSFKRQGLNEKLLKVLLEENPECEMNVIIEKNKSLFVDNPVTHSGIHFSVLQPARVFTQLSHPSPKGMSMVQREAFQYVEHLRSDKTRVEEDYDNSQALLAAIAQLKGKQS